MKVGDLLNPAPEEQEHKVPAPQQRPPLYPLKTQWSSAQRLCKQKLPKDAPIFRKGPTRGEVLFPPYEAGNDAILAKEHERYQVFPRGEIGQHCHHIPYSSDKKTFLSKTGRDAFEVFQYTFKIPGEEREYVVMWDYNIGLVRITPFFKCCKYSKTTPAKVLNVNPGLREISHSITGGALTAQGYWMPFACAKAVAATFAYNIRYALTPLFGKEFADNCRHPTDAMFAVFKIDSSIIQACVVETQKWLQRPDTHFTPGSSQEPSEAPCTPRAKALLPSWKKLKPKLAESATSPESGYGTDMDWSDYSPNLSPKTTWAIVNRPRSGTTSNGNAETSAAESLLMLSSPNSKPIFNKDIRLSVSPMTISEKREVGKRTHDELEEDYDVSDSSSSDDKKLLSDEGRKGSRPAESSAAMMLLQLRTRRATADGTCKGEHREKRQRRCSVPSQIP